MSITHLPYLFAFDLVSPAMLGWLAAAVAPLVIHMWSRRRYREMTFAAMEYLLAAFQQSRRRMRFEQWLLLLIRTLLVVLVVAAVAEPFFQRTGLTFVPGVRAHRVLVIDGSFSMGFSPTGKTRFERAKELARQIVEESPRGDGFTLVLMSDPPRTVVGNPVFEPRHLLPVIDDLRLPHATADLEGTLVEVQRVLSAARREHPRLGSEEVYFLTDLGRVGWAPDRAPVSQTAVSQTAVSQTAAAGVKARCRNLFKRLAESATLVVVDVGQMGAENVAVTAARTSEPFATAAGSFGIEADVKNFGRRRRNRQPVELVVDGRRVDEVRVDLDAGSEESVAFTHRFDAPGDHMIEIRAPGDQLDVDNHRFLAMPVKASIRVLLIDGHPSGEAFGSATDFLVYALAPGLGGPDPLPVRPDVLPESALLETDLSRYDCLFLVNVAQFTTSEAQSLNTYLRGGGSLVFFLGDRVLADRYNRILGDRRGQGVGLLPARLGDVVSKSQNRIDPLDYRHEIVWAFRGNERAGLLTTPVRTWFRLTIPRGSPSKVALALDDGSPLIVERSVHRGRVVLVATSADVSWTDMPILPSYLPIVQEILAFAVRGQFRDRNLLVGQSIGSTLGRPAGETSLVIHTPDGRRVPIRAKSDSDETVWSYSDTAISGIYTAEFGPPITTREAFALNVDPVESDLKKLSPEDFKEVWPEVPFVHQTNWRQADDQPIGPVGRPGRLAKTLLYAVLALLFIETYLARRFGYHASG